MPGILLEVWVSAKGTEIHPLWLVLIYQLSLSSGSHVAASIMPTRHGRVNRLRWVSSSSPAPCVVHVSQQTFPAGILFFFF